MAKVWQIIFTFNLYLIYHIVRFLAYTQKRIIINFYFALKIHKKIKSVYLKNKLISKILCNCLTILLCYAFPIFFNPKGSFMLPVRYPCKSKETYEKPNCLNSFKISAFCAINLLNSLSSISIRAISP